jgi:hypothetical protein
MPQKKPYFDDVVAEFERKIKERNKMLEMIRKNYFITNIKNFLIAQKKFGDMEYSATLVPVSMETCEKMAGKKVEIAQQNMHDRYVLRCCKCFHKW